MTAVDTHFRLPGVSRGRVLVYAAALVLTAAASAMSGRAVAEGNKLGVVLPVVLTVGIVLAVLALMRFSMFVLVLLVVRASADIGRVSASAAGNTSTNTSTARLADPSTIIAVLFLLAAVVWLAAQIRDRRTVQGSALGRTFVLFAAAGMLSVAGSLHPLSSGIESLRILAVVVMFIVLEQLMTTPETRKRLLAAAYVSLAFPLLFTLFGFLIGHPASESKGGFNRITGPFTQANTFGRYLMLMIVFGVALYPHLRPSLRRLLLPALVVSGAFLVFTYTRTALVGAVVGLIVVGVKQSKRVLVGLAVALIAAVILVPQFAGRFSSVASTPSNSPVAAAGPSGNSLDWRIQYWTTVLPLADSNPITGIGLNMTQYQTSAAKQPHNDFIRAYVETGVLGLAAYVALLAAMVRVARKAIKRTRPGTLDRGVAVGFLGCAVAYITVSLAANVVSNVVTLWYLAAFAAATVSIARSPTVAHPSTSVWADPARRRTDLEPPWKSSTT